MIKNKIKRAVSFLCSLGMISGMFPANVRNEVPSVRTYTYYDGSLLSGERHHGGADIVNAETPVFTHISGITPIYGNNDGPEVSVDDVTAEPGDDITLKIRVSDDTDGFDALMVYLNYDSRYFTYTDWCGGDEDDPDYEDSLQYLNTELNSKYITPGAEEYNKTLIFTYFDMERNHISGDMVLATVKFHVNEDAPAGVYCMYLDPVGRPGANMCSYSSIRNGKADVIGINPCYISGNVYIGDIFGTETTESEITTTVTTTTTPKPTTTVTTTTTPEPTTTVTTTTTPEPTTTVTTTTTPKQTTVTTTTTSKQTTAAVTERPVVTTPVTTSNGGVSKPSSYVDYRFVVKAEDITEDSAKDIIRVPVKISAAKLSAVKARFRVTNSSGKKAVILGAELCVPGRLEVSESNPGIVLWERVNKININYSFSDKVIFELLIRLPDDRSPDDKYTVIIDEFDAVNADCSTVIPLTRQKGTVTLEYVYHGDANNDGVISAADVLCLSRLLMNGRAMTAEEKKHSDINMDGKVNVFDMIRLKRMVIE